MVTDFYYPSTGGIETHIRYLSKSLIERGHKVIIITHSARNMDESPEFEDLKVYALNLPIVAMNTSFPTLFSNFLIYKKIFSEESIDIVHGHQSMSNLCLEGIFHGRTLNLRTVLTEHSLFEERPFENIIVNTLTKFILKTVDRCICVSQTSKENLHKRTEISLEKITVIQNGVISEKFYPPREVSKGKKIIVMSRLVYRKGIDLLVQAIPIICDSDKEINIFIAGDGPKIDEIQQVIDENDLSERVSIVGEIKHSEVGDFLRSGDVFLNTSLTETFCMAILEASMCGLHVVSTNVGGIHEVLPKELITFAKPTSEDLAIKVMEAVNNVDKETILAKYSFLKEKYSWNSIAEKTENLYCGIEHTEMTIVERLCLYNHVFEHFLIILEYVWLYFLSK
ncbi:Phosphatidylinositol N-acetylglucosaminyltransferase subunit A [Nosema granulosis]|uniref:Phosphatidylinositol N-acetylglucosaminyltransferase subunit A n=1 Tax=Nosema granulosis TaxID=83296 RepID=A0A9P6KZW7_9MICR|nr:Phosphatidylinositol N-acetylglucosaminyltransferase subunit A [Nosema granulosis]